jgi:hypothetical protein
MSAPVDPSARQRRAGLFLAAAALPGAAFARAQPPPDLILFHGRIITVDPHDSIAQGVAIRDGRITQPQMHRDLAAR